MFGLSNIRLSPIQVYLTNILVKSTADYIKNRGGTSGNKSYYIKKCCNHSKEIVCIKLQCIEVLR